MLNIHDIPLKEGLLERPRIEALVDHGLKHSLLTLFAGPGYGKTQAIAKSLANYDGRVLWLSLTSEDNSYTCFWHNLIQAAEKEFSALASYIKDIEFPRDLSQLDAFLKIFEKTIYEGKQAIWVIDNYEVIEDPKIINFFKMLVEARLKNFCLVILSTTRSNISMLNYLVDNIFFITSEELRFTNEEIQHLFNLYDFNLSAEELSRIEEITSGWPLPIYLLLLQYKKNGDLNDSNNLDVNQIFNNKFFSNYSSGLQRLLIKLSLLPSFTTNLMYKLYPQGEIAELDLVKDNIFITYDRNFKLHSFHYLYKLFLKDKADVISEKERLDLFQIAANHFANSNYFAEAITCYGECRDYMNMLKIISKFTSNFPGITDELSEVFLKHLEPMTKEQSSEYPLAEYLRAYIYLNNLQLEKAEAIIFDLEKTLLEKNLPDTLSLLGEAYSLHGAIRLLTNKEDFGKYYEKACGYLPNGTKFKAEDKLMIGNNSNFFLQDNKPGARERIEQAVREGVPWMVKALNGGMYGMEYLFSAEAAYFTYEFDKAKQNAYRCIYKAQHKAQHDLVCNAHSLLARIALMTGNFNEMSQEIQNVVDYTNKYDIATMRDMQNSALAWYYVKLEDLEKASPFISTIYQNANPSLSYGRDRLIHANYLICMEDFSGLIDLLKDPKDLYLSRGIWPDRATLYIMRAIGYLNLKDVKAAMESLWQAYDLCYLNDLTTLFVEAGKHMRTLIEAAKEQDFYRFDSAWLDLIYRRSNSFAKRSLTVRNAYKKADLKYADPQIKLTEREREILLNLSQGLTREEIADIHFLSINTVKSIIASIYTKLGATNRADAVFIAMSDGYIC